MSHLSDKELDRLSREAAEQNDVEQNTSGWDSLHLRLEKEMPVKPRKQRRSLLLLLSLLVLLTGSGLVYLYVNGPSPTIDKVFGTRTQAETPDFSGNLPAVAENQTEQNSTKKLKEISAPETEKNKETAATGTNGQKKPISDRQQQAVVNGTTDAKPSAAQKTKPIVAGSAKDLQSSGTIKSDNPRTGKDNSTIGRLVDRTIVSMFDAAMISISKPAIDKKNLDVVPSTVVTSEPAIARKNQQQRTAKKFPFSIAVTGGIDWTSVRFTHNDKAGYNAGVILSWHFARKFSLSTGALYTKKNYSAYGKDYHPPKGYWTNYITLDELNGSCWMIDIPLNLRYDFAGGKQFNFFGTAGVSTYLMNKESYTYHYMYNGNYTRRNWLNENNSSHVMSILNVSAGYEKSVGKKLSVQMEPYWKIPVSGIGFGKMQMNSYGINFAIRYRPEYKKQHTTVQGIHP